MHPQEREFEPIHVEHVEVGERHRTPTPEAIERLAGSMAEIGLPCPILVRVVEHIGPDGEEVGNSIWLVAGATRLAAAKSLGWEKIDAIFVECGDIEAEMVEIAENLHRAELTALERSGQVARWAELVEAHRVSSQPETKPQGGRPEAGVNAAARKMGLSKHDVHRAIKIASLSDEAKAAAQEHGLADNRSALLEAARHDDPDEQVRALTARAGAAASKRREKHAEGKTLREEAEEKIAALLAEHVPGDCWDALKANLYAAGCLNGNKIAKEFSRLVAIGRSAT